MLNVKFKTYLGHVLLSHKRPHHRLIFKCTSHSTTTKKKKKKSKWTSCLMWGVRCEVWGVNIAICLCFLWYVTFSAQSYIFNHPINQIKRPLHWPVQNFIIIEVTKLVNVRAIFWKWKIIEFYYFSLCLVIIEKAYLGSHLPPKLYYNSKFMYICSMLCCTRILHSRFYSL